jgi:amino acid permease
MPSSRQRKEEKKPMLFSALNYKLLGLGLLLIIVGFSAMRIENEVRGFVSLYISPPLVMAGYVTVAYAILKRDHKTEETETTANSGS